MTGFVGSRDQLVLNLCVVLAGVGREARVEGDGILLLGAEPSQVEEYRCWQLQLEGLSLGIPCDPYSRVGGSPGHTGMRRLCSCVFIYILGKD